MCDIENISSLPYSLIANYLVDKNVGLGKKYLINEPIYIDIANGNFGKETVKSFLNSLDRQRPSKKLINTRKWKQFGERVIPFRAYYYKPTIGKIKVFHLIPNNPVLKNRIHTRLRQREPDKEYFKPAS